MSANTLVVLLYWIKPIKLRRRMWRFYKSHGKPEGFHNKTRVSSYRASGFDFGQRRLPVLARFGCDAVLEKMWSMPDPRQSVSENGVMMSTGKMPARTR